MANDHSCIIVVPDADKVNVSKVLSAFWGDDPPGTGAFSVPLSANGSDPATHWALHLYQDAAAAAKLVAMPTPDGVGTVPSPLAVALSEYSVSQQDAQDACAEISRVSVMTGDEIDANDHLDTVLAGLSLQRIEA